MPTITIQRDDSFLGNQNTDQSNHTYIYSSTRYACFSPMYNVPFVYVYKYQNTRNGIIHPLFSTNINNNNAQNNNDNRCSITNKQTVLLFRLCIWSLKNSFATTFYCVKCICNVFKHYCAPVLFIVVHALFRCLHCFRSK